ncbi:hypothetical protein Tco_0056598 [Tanacetum coccineum]
MMSGTDPMGTAHHSTLSLLFRLTDVGYDGVLQKNFFFDILWISGVAHLRVNSLSERLLAAQAHPLKDTSNPLVLAEQQLIAIFYYIKYTIFQKSN